MLAASLEAGGLLVFTWRGGGPSASRPLQELESCQVGRHKYAVLSEILEWDGEAWRSRFLYRIAEGDKVISPETSGVPAWRQPEAVVVLDCPFSGMVARTLAPSW